MSGRRLVAVFWIALMVVACDGSEAMPSANLDATGILLVGVGEQVQGGPATEAFKMAFSDALVLAEANGNDLGYPWIDSSGVFSCPPLPRTVAISSRRRGSPFRTVSGT
jgi:hypothetical protein